MNKSISNKITLKGLQTRKNELEAKYTVACDRKMLAGNEVNDIKNKISAVDEQIAELTNTGLQVSEHAILRLIERKYKIYIKELEDEIREAVEPLTAKLGENLTAPLGNDLRAVVKGNVVVTVK